MLTSNMLSQSCRGLETDKTFKATGKGWQSRMNDAIRDWLKIYQMIRLNIPCSQDPIKLYPFTRSNIDNAPTIVVIDPALSAGRPVIAGTGLATEVIAERYKAGEAVGELAKDYERREAEIEEAIRCELKAAA